MKKLIAKLRATGATDEEIAKALAEDGFSEDQIVKAMETEELSEGEMEKALAELDDLGKSEDEDVDLDELIKALEDEEADLEKSEGDDDGGDDDGDAGDDDDDDLGKSMDDDNMMDELVKASEAYAELEKAIHASMGDIRMELRALSKAQLTATNLQIKTAKALASMAKSFQEGNNQAPAGPSRGHLGMGRADQDSDSIKKSKSEVQADLIKAVEEKRINPQYLSIFAVRGAEALPDFVKKEIGL